MYSITIETLREQIAGVAFSPSIKIQGRITPNNSNASFFDTLLVRCIVVGRYCQLRNQPRIPLQLGCFLNINFLEGTLHYSQNWKLSFKNVHFNLLEIDNALYIWS